MRFIALTHEPSPDVERGARSYQRGGPRMSRSDVSKGGFHASSGRLKRSNQTAYTSFSPCCRPFVTWFCGSRERHCEVGETILRFRRYVATLDLKIMSHL
jgi:hypothetical protein